VAQWLTAHAVLTPWTDPVLAAMWPLPLDGLAGAGAPRLPEASPAVPLPKGLDWRVGTAAQLTESGRA